MKLQKQMKKAQVTWQLRTFKLLLLLLLLLSLLLLLLLLLLIIIIIIIIISSSSNKYKKRGECAPITNVGSIKVQIINYSYTDIILAKLHMNLARRVNFFDVGLLLNKTYVVCQTVS